jgi:hypothetical protein
MGQARRQYCSARVMLLGLWLLRGHTGGSFKKEPGVDLSEAGFLEQSVALEPAGV